MQILIQRHAQRLRRPGRKDGQLTAALGEAVGLIDGNGADLGSVTVIKNGKPSTLMELPPASGNRYIAALVIYTARAPFAYNLFDWAMIYGRSSTSRSVWRPIHHSPTAR